MGYHYTMKLALAVLSIAATASAFTFINTPAASSLSHSVTTENAFASLPAPASGTQLNMAKQNPHGGTLVDLMLKTDAEKEVAVAATTKELQLSARQLCDVELIMDEGTYKHVIDNLALPDGLIFGLPVVFDTDDEDLQDGERNIATVEFADKFVPDKAYECKKCYGTSEIEHPGSLMVATERGKYYMGGKITGLNLPVRDFPCKTPAEVRETLPDDVDVVAFQCRNPVHRAHYELFTRALDDELVGEGG